MGARIGARCGTMGMGLRMVSGVGMSLRVVLRMWLTGGWDKAGVAAGDMGRVGYKAGDGAGDGLEMGLATERGWA